jgi:hypothetical protein
MPVNADVGISHFESGQSGIKIDTFDCKAVYFGA